MNKKLIRKMLNASGGPINYKRWDDAKITSYTIPFIKEKAIKLTNAGRATGAVLSTNLLDSLADNAIRAGVPIRTAIGISTKESTLGNPTDDRSAWNISSKIRKLFNGVYPGTVQHINNGTNLVNGINLINYHKGNIDHEMFNGAQGKSIIQEGLEFYKIHPDKYNPGLKGYQKAVDSRGEEVMNSPEVLKWYREWERSKAQIFRPEPYKINTNIQNTALEFVSRNKQGGKINIIKLFKEGGQIRKMQTASGGPIRRIKFTPEQIALFESQTIRVPGMNNSEGNRYREEGVLALQHLEQEAKRKEEEIKSRMEMRPTLKRKMTTVKKIRGKKDEYELKPQIVGMSEADPLLSFYVGGVGLNGIGALAKTGLWNIAKYAPTTQLGNWGRGYFVGNAFKSSFNGTVPTLTSLLTSKNLFRTKVYKGGEIEDPYSNFLTTDPKYAANYGKISPYIFESKSIAKAKEPMMGSSDPVTMDMFVYNNTKGNPNATAIIGHDKVTGEFTPSRGIEIYSMSPTNLFKINNSEKGKIFTGFREQQGLLDMMNNSHNAPHPPIYERVSYSKYSADAANPKERDLVIQHFKSRYPNSGLQVTSPLKISGFTYDNLLKVGELPLSEEGKAIANVMARRMKNYKLREGLDPNVVHFGQGRFSRSGIDGMISQIKNDKTIAYMPLKNSDNYGGLYEGGEALLKLNPWREKPYIYSLIHEGVSHMTDDFVKDLRTPLSEKKLLDDVARNFNGTKSSNSMYGRISYPSDIYDEKLIEKILHKDSMKPIESRSMNWEMITNLYKMLSKEKGISYKLATELPDSEFGAFVEKILDSPEKLSKFMEKFDNQYLLDYSNLMKAGTKELANQFYKRIKGMLKYGPSLITGGYFLTSQKQGGKMNILEFLKKGSGIHIKKKNRGKFTSYCGGKVTDECIRKAKASGNPTLVKRATFADNARHFKHSLGGLINKFLQGGAGWGLLASGVVNAGMLLYAANKLANAEKESAYANNKLNYQNLQELIVKDAIEKMNQEKKKWLEQYLSGQSLDNSWRSDAFTNYVLQLIINQKLVGAKNKLELEDALAKAKAESKEADAMNSAFSSVIQNGLETLISNLGNKKIINSSVNSTNNSNINSNNFWDNPTIKNSLVTGDFWNNPTIANSLA